MKKSLMVVLIIVSLVSLAGCGARMAATPSASVGVARDLEYAAPRPGQPQAPALESKTVGGRQAEVSDGVGAQPQSANAAGAQRMIVYSGQLALVVKDTAATVEQITQIVQGAGGFVTASNAYKDQGHTRATMAVRVPGEDLEQLKATLAKIKALAVTVESENLNGQDVTDQFADTQAEIENLSLQRDSYRKLLDRATKMEDILSIQTRLDQAQGQINALTGRQLKLKESVKLATVTLTLTPDALAQPIVIGTWKPQGTARDAFRALLNALKAVGDIVIWSAICILPMVLLIGLPIYLVARFALSRRRRKVASKPQA